MRPRETATATPAETEALMELAALRAMQEVKTPDGKGIIVGRCFKNGDELGILVCLPWNAGTGKGYEKPPLGISPCMHRVYLLEQLEALP